MPAKRKPRSPSGHAASSAAPTMLRVIGGSMRGRPILYHGDPLTRPMKDRVREAVFNLLGKSVEGTIAVDLFAGTGALGLEAISRGAVHATCVERHFPSARLIQRNVAELEVADRVETVAGDTFVWALRHGGLDGLAAGDQPWIVFCSPPYDLYVSRRDEMIALVEKAASLAPAGSQLVVESDDRFAAPDAWPQFDWDVRVYKPAVVAIATIA